MEAGLRQAPVISVIMGVYNAETFLEEAIKSILNQSFRDFEFIIVNDASTDNSVAIINRFNDDRIRVINNESNIGLTRSLNKAIRQAHGEFIARMDADDISFPDRFREQVNF
ncbi:MAG: glycosyltransferase family 2 protein [Ferruginibacter sp.]